METEGRARAHFEQRIPNPHEALLVAAARLERGDPTLQREHVAALGLAGEPPRERLDRPTAR